VPVVQTVYWLDTTTLPSGDPEERRAVVVLAVPNSPSGTVIVVSRSASDRFGVEHGVDPRLGLSTPGRFSRRHPVPRQMWTSAHVSLIGPLDDATFAAVVSRFGRFGQ
jgi:hypothetical protein